MDMTTSNERNNTKTLSQVTSGFCCGKLAANFFAAPTNWPYFKLLQGAPMKETYYPDEWDMKCYRDRQQGWVMLVIVVFSIDEIWKPSSKRLQTKGENSQEEQHRPHSSLSQWRKWHDYQIGRRPWRFGCSFEWPNANRVNRARSPKMLAYRVLMEHRNTLEQTDATSSGTRSTTSGPSHWGHTLICSPRRGFGNLKILSIWNDILEETRDTLWGLLAAQRPLSDHSTRPIWSDPFLDILKHEALKQKWFFSGHYFWFNQNNREIVRIQDNNVP